MKGTFASGIHWSILKGGTDLNDLEKSISTLIITNLWFSFQTLSFQFTPVHPNAYSLLFYKHFLKR